MSRITFVEEAGSPLYSTKSGDFASTGENNNGDDDDGVKQQDSGTMMSEASSAQPPLYVGTGYELGIKHYRDPTGMDKPYYFTSKLGAPFPSYHSNPEAFFPPRWTSIRDAKLPVESLTAPRIRFGPRELEDRHVLYKQMTRDATRQVVKPKPKVLNLSHQALGDPYQFEALRLQLALNDSVETLTLSDNELEDISMLPLQSVKRLYLDNNNISSFRQLPVLPNCRELILTSNFLTGYDGLEEERFPKLVKICVHGNPLCTRNRHRFDIVKRLPRVLHVDWFTKARIVLGETVSAKDVHRGHDDDECC